MDGEPRARGKGLRMQQGMRTAGVALLMAALTGCALLQATTPETEDAARTAADSILAEYGDKLPDKSLLTLSYLRGNSDGRSQALQTSARIVDLNRHARVITGTGNAAERRELAALCRGLKESA